MRAWRWVVLGVVAIGCGGSEPEPEVPPTSRPQTVLLLPAGSAAGGTATNTGGCPYYGGRVSNLPPGPSRTLEATMTGECNPRPTSRAAPYVVHTAPTFTPAPPRATPPIFPAAQKR